MSVKLNTEYLNGFVLLDEIKSLQSSVTDAHNKLHNHCGKGSEFTGWLDLPRNYDKEEFQRIKEAASKIQKDTDVFICIGIGGSYLGAKAVIDFIKSSNYNGVEKNTPDVYFVGNSISSDEFCAVMDICRDRDVSLNVISKSGTTTEPAIAFRFFKKFMEDKYGKEGAAKRIYVTTDRKKGTLKELSDREGYETFVVPDDIGGRYSVLTAVGLLPIAVCGIDIDRLMDGARLAMDELSSESLNENDCYKYAAVRNILYKKGKKVELLVSYEPCFSMMGEWFKQLFGESEGKENLGLFPASATFSTDLHSLGQYIQQGERILFETVVDIKKPDRECFVINDDDNLDGLNFISGKSMSEINGIALKATLLAHIDGGVPNVIIEMPDKSEFELGYLLYFFEKACAVSGYILGVNPFDQPGVESYKKNMFALLGKPGYEEEKARIEQRLKK